MSEESRMPRVAVKCLEMRRKKKKNDRKGGGGGGLNLLSI